MATKYYEQCVEFDECNKLSEKYFRTSQLVRRLKVQVEETSTGYAVEYCEVGYY